MSKNIPIVGKQIVAIVDDEDFPFLSRFRWSVGENGTVAHTFTGLNGRQVLIPIFSFLISKKANERIYHINQNPLDNRKRNLIVRDYGNATHHFKKQVGTNSKYKGVFRLKTGNYWIANITFQRKRYYLGCFSSEVDAAIEYNKKALEFYSENAYQNNVY